MEELLKIIQQDPELWELVERLKHSEQTEVEFFTQVANMLAVEFEELHRTDLRDKLSALFGGLPKKSYIMVPYNTVRKKEIVPNLIHCCLYI